MTFCLISKPMMETMKQLASSAPEGCFVEVGVYQGGSAVELYKVAKEQNRQLFLYDTFSGMPFADEIDSHHVGMFSDCNVDEVKALMPDAIIRKGLFPGTLINMGKIAFVHADADQYRSTHDICNYLGPMMAKGGLMLFDDYRVEGCAKALDECYPQREILPDGRALVKF